MGRLFGYLGAGGFAALAIAGLTFPQSNLTRIFVFLIATLTAGWSYCLLARPRLVIEDDRILVVAPIGSRQLHRSDVRGFSGGRFLVAHLEDGSELKVFAVQNANLTLMAGREGRTQRVASQLNQMLDDAQGGLCRGQPSA